MKRAIFIFLVLSIVSLSDPSLASTAQTFKGGVKDILTSPLQISDNVKSETANAKFLPFALVGGLLKGSFYMAKKVVTGTLTVVTAPLDMIHK